MVSPGDPALGVAGVGAPALPLLGLELELELLLLELELLLLELALELLLELEELEDDGDDEALDELLGGLGGCGWDMLDWEAQAPSSNNAAAPRVSRIQKPM